MTLRDELETYIIYMNSGSEFSYLKEICDLVQKMVETKKTHCVFTYLFACYIVFNSTYCNFNYGESIFGYEYCDHLFVYVEKNIFDNIDNETNTFKI